MKFPLLLDALWRVMYNSFLPLLVFIEYLLLERMLAKSNAEPDYYGSIQFWIDSMLFMGFGVWTMLVLVYAMLLWHTYRMRILTETYVNMSMVKAPEQTDDPP